MLADDHALMREGLRILLEREGDITVIAQAEAGREAVEFVRTLVPNIVVMDIGMPLLNGIEATRQIVTSGAPTKVIVLSGRTEDEYFHQAIEAGAAGYLVKDTSLP